MDILKVLTVDDEPGIRSGISRILGSHIVSFPFMDDDLQFECLEAANGEEALKVIDQEHPDIVLLDNKLPGIQGMDVLEYIRRNNYDITVAMITSYASLDTAVKATNIGAYDFIPKPFTPRELKASIDTLSKQLFLKRITLKMKNEGKRIRYQFLSILSHELKSPLNAVEGYLEIMKERKSGNDIENYMEMIDRSLERIQAMRNLTMDLLDFSRVRLEKKEGKIEEVDLEKIAKISISTVKPYAIQKGIKIELHSDPDTRINADPYDIEMIMNNLLSNAVKYNRKDGKVMVNIVKGQEIISLEVKDTGIGMDKDEIGQLFREFVRIRNEKTKNIHGSGLGLSIVKKITDIYRGKILVDSIPDKETSFKIVLPIN